MATGHSMRVDSGQHPLPVTEEESATGLVSDSIPMSMFSCPGAAGFKVRGPTYLQDKKKVALSLHLCNLHALLASCESVSTGQDKSSQVRSMQVMSAGQEIDCGLPWLLISCLPVLSCICCTMAPAMLPSGPHPVSLATGQAPLLSWLDERGWVSVVSLPGLQCVAIVQL